MPNEDLKSFWMGEYRARILAGEINKIPEPVRTKRRAKCDIHCDWVEKPMRKLAGPSFYIKVCDDCWPLLMEGL